MQTYNQLLKFLGDVMQKVNPDAATAYSSSALAIWSEGGEWPAYDESYESFTMDETPRDMNVPFTNPGNLNNLANVLDNKFADSTVVGLTLECGAGKSTRVVEAMHSLKLGKRTIVVEPSAVVAQGLAEFMSSKGKGCQYAMTAADIPQSRGITYISVGCMLDALLRGVISTSDIVVLDEAHCVTFTHTIVEEILSRMQVRVLLMTASTTPVIRGLRGSKIVPVQVMDNELSEALAKEGDKAVMVGVTENQTYAAPASAFIGATFDVKVIYDTGLRPEPRLKNGVLMEGERKATQLEILQMVGRVGRNRQGGTAYYNDKARVMPGEGIALYDIMHRSIKAAIGLDKKLSREKAVSAWKLSGIIGGSPTHSRTSSDSESVKKVAVVSGDVHVEGSDDDNDGWQEIRNVVKNDRSGSTESSGSNKSVTRFHRRRTGGVITLESAVVDRRTHQHLADLAPDPNWRPFKRGADLREGETANESSIMRFIDWIRDAHNRGDMIVPMKFPKADSSVISGVSKEEARLVLAGRMLPAYTELELLSIVVLWNEIADASRGPMRPAYLTQFLDYFESYSQFCRVRM